MHVLTRETVINIKKVGKTWKNLGNRWQIDSALINRQNRFNVSNNRLTSCYKPEKSIGLFFIVEIIDFDL